MGGSSKKQTVGYWYKLLYHAGLSKGPIDAFLEFRGGDKTAWKGGLTASTTITIDEPKLWGGEKDQGGIVSDVDVMFGEAGQAANAYLLANLGAQVPAWRGLATLVFKGGKYGAMNPYPQKASYKIRKILQGWDGAAWYPEKAPIELAAFRYDYDDLWAYQVVPAVDGGAPGVPAAFIDPLYDDSSWPVGPGGFGSGGPGAGFGVGTFVAAGEIGKGIWLRKRIDIEHPELATDMEVQVYHDDGRWLWWNGEAIPVVQQPDYFRSTATIPANKILAQNVIVLQVLDSIPDGSPSNIYAGLAIATGESALVAMNPAHILYYARTNADMGREPTANINTASLTAAADTLFAEGFGICTTHDPAQESVEEFENRITKLIDGSFSRDPITGQWYLDLARGDYVLGDLPILTDDDILEFREQPSTLDNAINSVSVTYFDPERKETITTPPVQALALVQDFGTIHQTIEYPEIPTATLAARVAERELRATATPTRAFDLVCTRKPYAWRPNTYFRLQVPKRGIADMVCIVGEKESGSLKSGAIRLRAAQDIYSMPSASFVEVEPGVDTSPSPVPVPITQQAAFEAPYVELVGNLSRADLSVLPEDAAYLLAVAADPATSRDYTMMVDAGGGYLETANGDWCPTATVVEASSWLDTAFTLAGGTRLDEVVVGSAALWDSEIVRVDAINPATGAITLARACADTLPAQHAAGSRIWFYRDSEAVDLTEYSAGEALNVKLLTNTVSQQLDIALAAPIAVGMGGRAVLPYPPANLRINSAYYPASIGTAELLTIDWAHRDRILQADQLVDFLQPDIGPEPGVTYNLRLYDQNDILRRTETGLTVTSYTWADETADSGLPPTGGDTYPVAVAADTPHAWWRLGDASGTTAVEQSGTYNGTYVGTPTLGVPGLLLDDPGADTCADFSGSGQRVDCPYLGNTGFPLAIEAIFELDALGNIRALVTTNDTGSRYAGLSFLIGSDGNVALRIGNGGTANSSSRKEFYFATGFEVGKRYYVHAIANSMTDVRLFAGELGQNNLAEVSLTGTSGSASSMSTAIGFPYIGYSPVNNTYLDGRIDEPAIYTEDIGDARRAAHYAAASGQFSALNSSVRFELEAARGGLISRETYNITVPRVD